jgi:hypothetical protein
LGAAHDEQQLLRAELETLNNMLQKEQQKQKQQHELLIKLRKKYQLITKERDSYRWIPA